MHKRCVEIMREKDQLRQLQHSFAAEEARAREVLARLFKVLGHVAKHKQSLVSFERTIKLLSDCDADVGTRCHGRNTARHMAALMVDVTKAHLRQFLETPNPMMNHKPHVSVAADKTTDHGGVQSEMIHIRVNYNGTPLHIALSLAEMDGAYSEDSAGNKSDVEAGGYQCFNKILEELETVRPIPVL